MPAPTSIIAWDTNATNATATTSGHQSDGFVTNEVPTSAELNWWMSQVATHIAYLEAAAVPRTRVLPLNIASAKTWGAGATATLTLSGSTRYVLVNTGPADISWDIPLPVGSTITSCTLLYNREASAAFGITLARWSSTGSETVVASVVDNASSGDTSLDLATGATFGALPFTTLANETISLDVDAQTGARIYGAIIGYTLPTP